MPLAPNVIDVFLGTPDQQPAAHQGPVGRIQSAKQVETLHFQPPTRDVPQRLRLQARAGFVSLADELRTSNTGAVETGVWSPPQFMEPLGDQLVDVVNGQPRVWNGNTWTSYSTARVLANQLSEEVFHTSDRTIQAPDSAWLAGVTCSVWTETRANARGLTVIGFKDDNGAWIVTPRTLFDPDDPTVRVLAKVVTDGSQFWVVFNGLSDLTIATYDTHGVRTAITTIARVDTDRPGFWDIIGTTLGMTLAQPGVDPPTDGGVKFTTATRASSTITLVSSTDATLHCNGPLAWLTNDLNALQYIATVGPGEGGGRLWAYEVTVRAQTHVYDYAVGVPPPLDSLIGFTETVAAAVAVYVGVSYLSDVSPPAGPVNDPGFRHIDVHLCTRAGVVTFVKTCRSVVAVTRAFKLNTSYYCVSYYQSGGGLAASTTETVSIGEENDDFMIGAAVQELDVAAGDWLSGAPFNIPGPIYVMESQDFPSDIPHNAGDTLNATTGEWQFLNSNTGGRPGFIVATNPYPGSTITVNSLLVIAGSSIATNNDAWRITRVIDAQTIETELFSLINGTRLLPDTLAGVTATITPMTIVQASQLGLRVPADLAGLFYFGHVIITGSTAGNNGTLLIFRYQPSLTYPDITDLGPSFLCAWNSNNFEVLDGTTKRATGEPAVPYAWHIASHPFIDSEDVGANLVVTGASYASSGTFPITSAAAEGIVTGGQPTLVAQVFGVGIVSIPTIKIALADPATAYTFHFDNATFDASYIGGIIRVVDSDKPQNNGTYKITQIIDSTTVIAPPNDGNSSQVNQTFLFSSSVVVTIEHSGGGATFQPTWFVSPLDVQQQIAGEFERGIAYADWRFDGETPFPNLYPCDVSSICRTADGWKFVLPYRALTFSSGRVRVPTGSAVPAGAENTIGTKQFEIAEAMGLGAEVSGELLIPGLMATQFTASGFSESAVSLGFELPFVVSQADSSGVVGLEVGQHYQYVIVAEVTDENGDRIKVGPSPPLDVVAFQNTITIGGRLIGPTNRPVVGICVYRTAVRGGVPTVQHYMVTDPLDVNGAGFTFPNAYTWQFVDNRADADILSSEVVYTDRGQLARYPAPASSFAVGSWLNREWVIGYDGAIWMSGEKVEGEAHWFHPAFRFILPTDDDPVALAAMDDYLVVFCRGSRWYIPKAGDLPDATGRNGKLPTPIQIPGRVGCTGFAGTIRAGAVYSARTGPEGTPSGVWLLTRQLTDVWLSEPLMDAMGPITGIAVGPDQRLFVSTGTSDLFAYDQEAGVWYHWTLPSSTVLVTVYQGAAVYQDDARVNVQTPGALADHVGGATTGIAPDITLADISFANVRGLKHIWEGQLVGEYLGPHQLTVILSYPDEAGAAPTVFTSYTPDPAAPYLLAFNPEIEETGTLGLRVFADFAGIEPPGASFTLELISFEVGIDAKSGAAKTLPAQRMESG